MGSGRLAGGMFIYAFVALTGDALCRRGIPVDVRDVARTVRYSWLLDPTPIPYPFPQMRPSARPHRRSPVRHAVLTDAVPVMVQGPLLCTSDKVLPELSG